MPGVKLEFRSWTARTERSVRDGNSELHKSAGVSRTGRKARYAPSKQAFLGIGEYDKHINHGNQVIKSKMSDSSIFPRR